MSVQLGDIINGAKLAWDVYNAGWTDELRANTQYGQFGAEIRQLAKNLSVLESVVVKAQESLRSHGVSNSSQIRWDPASLFDIVGDFQVTLKECDQLLKDNERYNFAPNNPLRNIEWNVLVQPTANRLRERIQLQSTRIQSVLKPFEIDLLTRIHADLAQRISAVQDDVRLVRSDLRSLIGVLVPNLGTALDQQDALRIRLLPVPPDIEQGLEKIFNLHPALQDNKRPPLRDMADAFTSSLEQSTKCFKPGLIARERIPPVDQFINLLKSLFLLKKMEASDELENASPQSHWPSYIKELKERVSHECDEFHHCMVEPSFQLVDIDEEILDFWIKETPEDLIDVATARVVMEELMEIPLFTASTSVSKRIRLLRHTGTRDKKFRLVISATERQTNGRSRQQREVVDFDVTAATINPLYALFPGAAKAPYEMILEANNKIHRLAFSVLEDAFLFQQGITGFKVVDGYSEPHAKASFVIKGQGGSILEDVSIQLWIQRRLGGNRVPDNSDSSSPIDTPPSPTPTPTPTLGIPVTISSPRGSVPEFGGQHHFSSPESMSAEFGSMSLSSSPGTMSTRPDMAARSPNTPPMASPGGFQSSPNRSHTLGGAFGPFSTSPGQDSSSSGSFMERFRIRRRRQPSQDLRARTQSVSSNMTTETTLTVQSNSSSDTTVTVHESGKTRTAVIHSRPLKPMIILFARDAEMDRRAIVAVSIDEETIPNPQGCWCQQRTGPDGNPCQITVLEQSGGDEALEARRLQSSTGQWDLLPLCMSRREENRGFAGATWRNLSRVSMLFLNAEARIRFGGEFCMCKQRTRKPQTKGELIECMKNGHAGLLGHVRFYYQLEVDKWWKGRFGKNVHVADMSFGGGPGNPVWRRP